MMRQGRGDWIEAVKLSGQDKSFKILLMAAYMKADLHNRAMIEAGWPDIAKEAQQRRAAQANTSSDPNDYQGV